MGVGSRQDSWRERELMMATRVAEACDGLARGGEGGEADVQERQASHGAEARIPDRGVLDRESRRKRNLCPTP
eukprot:6902968-Pyramimonas_sp.AAC.1